VIVTKPSVSSSKRYAKSAPVTRKNFDDLRPDNDSVPLFWSELRSRTSERSPSTTPPQKGKNPGPGERRFPSCRWMKLSKETKTAMASQNRLLARSLDILVRRQREAEEMFFTTKSTKVTNTNSNFEMRISKLRFAFYALGSLWLTIFSSFRSIRDFLVLGLLYQCSLLGDLFHGSMLLAYFSEELLWRHVILDHAQSGELGGNGRVLHCLFNSGN
jgi:hypothetical protein